VSTIEGPLRAALHLHGKPVPAAQEANRDAKMEAAQTPDDQEPAEVKLPQEPEEFAFQ
jgi:hypothetical protein